MLKRILKERAPRGLLRLAKLGVEEGATFLRHQWGRIQARSYRGKTGLKLNIGCGPNLKSGWVNIDLVPGCDLSLDGREKLPFDDGSCSVVYSEHFVEHLEYPDDAFRFFSESYRVLQPGGTFSAGVPDTEWPLKDYAAGGADWLAFVKNGQHPSWCLTRMEHINFHFRQNIEHRFAYDYETFEAALRKAGFMEVRRREFDPQLDAESRKIGTLYVEAVK